MFVYYVQPLYILIVFKKFKNMSKLYSLGTKKQNKLFYEDENIQFNFLGTKIKIHYIYRDEKLI